MANIVLTSSGITGTNFSIKFLDKYIKDKNILVVDNGTIGTSNYEKRLNNVNKFYEYNAKDVKLLTINKDNQNIILNYDICYMMGGSIANLLDLLQTTDIKNILTKFLNTGIYIGESAGSLILDENVKWYFNLKKGTKPKYDKQFDSYNGLGFISKHIYPHYNKADEEMIQKINNYNEQIYPLNDGEYLEISTYK